MCPPKVVVVVEQRQGRRVREKMIENYMTSEGCLTVLFTRLWSIIVDENQVQ